MIAIIKEANKANIRSAMHHPTPPLSTARSGTLIVGGGGGGGGGGRGLGGGWLLPMVLQRNSFRKVKTILLTSNFGHNV